MLTKEMMQKMKEDELSRKVIIPLLREMGFHDVHYYGGGSGELGKDVVCWKPDELDARRNYVMVIKAINITGQAKSVKGSAGEVATQVQQAFGSTFLDTVTTEPQDVHVCWIITNKQINKEAKQAIKSILKATNLDRHIRFVDGDVLWGYVEEHMASETLMGKFQKIQKELSSIDTHYHPIIKISGDQIFIGLEEKYKGAAEEKPLKFDLAFQFPDTPEGQAAKFALQQHHATGAPASISSEFVQSIEYPELIKALFGTDVAESATIELASMPSDHHLLHKWMSYAMMGINLI